MSERVVEVRQELRNQAPQLETQLEETQTQSETIGPQIIFQGKGLGTLRQISVTPVISFFENSQWYPTLLFWYF